MLYVQHDDPVDKSIGDPHRGADGERQVGLGAASCLRFGGELINADSMQVYRDLRVLTARPDHEDEAKAPHRLLGTSTAR